MREIKHKSQTKSLNRGKGTYNIGVGELSFGGDDSNKAGFSQSMGDSFNWQDMRLQPAESEFKSQVSCYYSKKILIDFLKNFCYNNIIINKKGKIMNRNKQIARLHYKWREEEAKRLKAKAEKEKSNTAK